MTEWTEGRKKAFIISVLRSGSRRWPPKYQCLNLAKTEKRVNEKTKRLAQHYMCKVCQQEFTNKDVEVDHIVPVVDPKKGFKNWDTFIARLFCDIDNLQVVCKPCHREKSNKEKVKK